MRRNVNISVDIVLANSLDNTLSTFDMDILQRVVPITTLAPALNWPIRMKMIILGGIVSADEIKDNVGMSNTGLD